ncbi:SH3 domain-containing protein [Enterobacter sp. Bisph1]|uniref:SH3 domain-containing protein n=1 Tax=Enterobacter sp. Bisph1 TaxID=1274399 RepID=UPI00057BF2F5|nr:SH3 domain-containing protein [Enterobacter sp. Bisph1]
MITCAVVIKNYTSAFPDPISIKKNATAVVSHCDLQYRGWVWITLDNGHAGWAPQQLFLPQSANKILCLEDYTARELSVIVGEKITIGTSLNGWCWATNVAGESGWLPEENIDIK